MATDKAGGRSRPAPPRPMTRLHRIGGALLVGACITSAVLSLTPAPGSAQTGSTPSTTAPGSTPSRIELIAQDAWTPVGGDVNMRFNVVNPPPGARVHFTIFFAARTRAAFDTAFVAGALPNDVLGLLSVPLEQIPTDASGARVLMVGLGQSAASEVDRLNIGEPGVYPLKIELRDENARVVSNSFVTALVVSQPDGRSTVAERLRFVWIWPLLAAPSYLPNGQLDPDVMAALQPSGRLGKQAVALRDAADLPVTVIPGPETMAAWVQAGRDSVSVDAGAAAVRDAAVTHQALGNTYVPVDIPSLLDHGHSIAVDEELARGNEVFAATVGLNPDSRTRLVRPASPAALARLSANGANRVIVDGSALASTDNRGPGAATPVTPVRIRVNTLASDSVDALVIDAGLQGLLTSDLPVALRAQLLLGGLSVVAAGSPSSPRVITVANPDNFDAPVELFGAVLKGLRDNPYVVPVTAAQAFDAVTPESTAGSVMREPIAAPSAEPPVSASAYVAQRTRLTSLGVLAQQDALAVDPAARAIQASVAAADRAILASVSSAWPPDAGRARAARHLETVDRVVNRFVSQIEVPDPRTITLTSRSGEIPLTFRNDTGSVVRLRAALSSAKLAFPEGSVIDLELPPKSSTVRVAVETRTSGTFPISLEVTSIDGVLPISQRRLAVRSTFVSTVGLVLTVSAVVFLAAWWGFDLRRRRRRRTPIAES